ncbi:MAG: T9SS type A sorting domain-containing protein [Bacteroidia bacterium]|nr:T9SS type A sorting domain-containing protein [Bacteroidia bacterium]
MKGLSLLLFIVMSFTGKSQVNCQGLTHLQGAYGAPNLNDPLSVYMLANFNGAFPNGLTIGCNNTLSLTSVVEVKNFLPSSGTPTSLPAGITLNPGNTYNNTFAGQLVALKLNVGFDNYDPNFSPSPVTLGNYTITAGIFAGMSVNAFLTLANNAIGGCGSIYSFSDLSTTADMINQNFNNGTQNNNYLTCISCSVSANLTSGTIPCYGGSTTATITASNGQAPYTGVGTYSLNAGPYSFTVTDALGCASIITGTISEPSALNILSTFGNILCNGGTTTLNVSANGGTAPYGGVGIYTVSAGGQTLMVIDANGCVATNITNVTQPASLTVLSTFGNILCNGGTTTLHVSASGGTAPYFGTGTYTVSAGPQTLTVIDVNGCVASGITNVTQPASLTVLSTFGNILCNGGTTTLNVSASGGTAPYFGTGIYTVSAGPQTLTVIDVNGCVASGITNVTQPAALNVFSSFGNILCNGGTTTLNVSANGGTAPYFGTGTYTVSAGPQTLTVIDNNGCVASGITNVTQPASLTVLSSFGNILCNGGTTTLNVSASGGTAPYGGVGTFTVSAGSQTLMVIDANSCVSSTIINITQPASLSVFSTFGNILCHGGTTTLNISASGGTSPYFGTGTYTVSAGTFTNVISDSNGCSTSTIGNITAPSALTVTSNYGVILCNGGTTTLNITASGGTLPYSGTGLFIVNAGNFTNTVSDANGCVNSTSGIIAQPAALQLSSNHGAILCNGGTTTLNINASGGTSPYNGTGNYTVGAGLHTYTVVDFNECVTSITVLISQPSLLSLTATNGNILCHGGSTTLSIIGSGGVMPYTGTGLYTLTAGNYSYTVTDANSCTSSISGMITQPSAIGMTSQAGIIFCHGGTTTIQINATGGTSPYLGTGIYTVAAGTTNFTVTDANACSSSTTITITQPSPLVATSLMGPTPCLGSLSTVTLIASGGSSPYTGTGVFAVGAGIHTYTVYDTYFCFDTVSVIVDTLYCTNLTQHRLNENRLLVYPNPNNGNFKLSGKCDETLVLLNQIGQLVKEIELIKDLEIEIENLPGGIYFLVGDKVKLKIVVQDH